jgi:hypothetical protein
MPKQPPPFDPDSYYRPRQIVQPEGPIAVSRGTWWRWSRQGRLPPPLRSRTAAVVWSGRDLNARHLPLKRTSTSTG